jgi:RNA polymerase sigma factor (sigma-70 family)
VAFDFEQIYKEHFSAVYKYVLSVSRDETVAEEVTQETFFKAMQHIDGFNGTCKLYVWLCQIAKNTYFSFYQKRKRYVPGVDPDIQTKIDIKGIILTGTQRNDYTVCFIILMNRTRKFSLCGSLENCHFYRLVNCSGKATVGQD